MSQLSLLASSLQVIKELCFLYSVYCII